MSERTTESKNLQQIVSGALSREDERTLLERLVKEDPVAALSLVPLLAEQRRQMQDALHQAPWHPAIVLRVLAAEARVLVAMGNRQTAVGLAPGVAAQSLRRGSRVFLNATMTTLLGSCGDVPMAGDVGVFSCLHRGLAVLRGHADEEIVVDLAEDVRAGELAAGDRLLYDRESRVAFARVDRASRRARPLDEVPDVTVDQIGGLDECVTEILDALSLHVQHRELVRQHRLEPIKGIILHGPPGVGKTMIAKAVANYLAHLEGAEVAFFSVKPGEHRSMWYGQAEAQIRDLFAAAREAASVEGRFSVVFFDDIDAIGARSESATATVDARVLPAFLAEIDGIVDLRRVCVIGATNRPDLLDQALLREGRFGDKVFRIPRPGRRAARDILSKHLLPELPLHGVNGDGPEALVAEMIETALARIYAPNGEASTLATLVFRDGTRRPVTASEVMSGALLVRSVDEAKERSCRRALRGLPAGITTGDLLGAIDGQLRAVAERLRPGPALRELLDLPTDLDVVKVEPDGWLKRPPSHHYVRWQAAAV